MSVTNVNTVQWIPICYPTVAISRQDRCSLFMFANNEDKLIALQPLQTIHSCNFLRFQLLFGGYWHGVCLNSLSNCILSLSIINFLDSVPILILSSSCISQPHINQVMDGLIPTRCRFSVFILVSVQFGLASIKMFSTSVYPSGIKGFSPFTDFGAEIYT